MNNDVDQIFIKQLASIVTEQYLFKQVKKKKNRAFAKPYGFLYNGMRFHNIPSLHALS